MHSTVFEFKFLIFLTFAVISFDSKNLIVACACAKRQTFQLSFFTARVRTLTRVCPSIHPSINLSVHRRGGGVPISHNALQHFPDCHGAARGGTLPGPAGGVPWPGGTLAGGYPGRGGTLAGGEYSVRGVPWLGGYPGRGGTQLGQHREYLLHGGRYASCVHAGGLSCSFYRITLRKWMYWVYVVNQTGKGGHHTIDGCRKTAEISLLLIPASESAALQLC